MYMVKVALILIVLMSVMTGPPAAGLQGSSGETAKDHAKINNGQARLLAEARTKVLQVFGGAVAVAENPDAIVMTGDFNGDGWQDLAVVVRCALGKADKLNDPYANWTVENPRRLRPPELNHMTLQPLPHPPSREPIHAGDFLLAIIHGDGPAGWRDPKASQAFLLYNSVGKELSVKNHQRVITSTDRRRVMPPLRGDVITQVVGEQTGFVYWLGGEYLWFHDDASQQKITGSMERK
jgi:hypothetical protein